jgi:tRNA U55 pseudouridine synthase TruB
MPRPPKHITLYKQRGETPLAAIGRWQAANPKFAHLTASYAGRLDPMAEGKLLILLGDECRRQKEYTKLDKEYVVEMLLDFSTDTGDTLGLPAYAMTETHPSKEEVRATLERVVGSHVVPYPAFSSKPVNGKPLFQYALEGTLDSIEIPTHEEKIYRAKLMKMTRVPGSLLRDRIEDILSVVPKTDEPSKALGADFRQEVIRAGWRNLLSSIHEREYTVLTLRVPCASGTYMRTLVERIAEMLGSRALALSIVRTRIGSYGKLGPLGFWLRSF